MSPEDLTAAQDAPDFFQPRHASHAIEERPEVAPYLGLPPGWAFIVAPGFAN